MLLGYLTLGVHTFGETQLEDRVTAILVEPREMQTSAGNSTKRCLLGDCCSSILIGVFIDLSGLHYVVLIDIKLRILVQPLQRTTGRK